MLDQHPFLPSCPDLFRAPMARRFNRRMVVRPRAKGPHNEAVTRPIRSCRETFVVPPLLAEGGPGWTGSSLFSSALQFLLRLAAVSWAIASLPAAIFLKRASKASHHIPSRSLSSARGCRKTKRSYPVLATIRECNSGYPAPRLAHASSPCATVRVWHGPRPHGLHQLRPTSPP